MKNMVIFFAQQAVFRAQICLGPSVGFNKSTAHLSADIKDNSRIVGLSLVPSRDLPPHMKTYQYGENGSYAGAVQHFQTDRRITGIELANFGASLSRLWHFKVL